VAALAFSLCGVTAVAQDHLSPERQAAARQALIAWYECVECTSGELQTLMSFGPAVEGALISTLRDGLTPAKRAQVEQELRASYKASLPMPVEENQYVSTYLANRTARYQSRAAVALAQLASPNAVIALNRAADDAKLRHDVRTEAKRALVRLHSP
jgi:hypothetical protein